MTTPSTDWVHLIPEASETTLPYLGDNAPRHVGSDAGSNGVVVDSSNVISNGSLYATVGMVLDYARSEAELHNAELQFSSGVVNPTAKSANGGLVADFGTEVYGPLEEWKGGGFDDLEALGESIAGSGGINAHMWRTTSRLQPIQWAREIEPFIEEEMERLGPLLRFLDFVSLAIGTDWTEDSGLEQRAWLTETITKLQRFNASPMAKKCGVYIMLRACHINVKAGEGLLRPMRPHWHLVLAVLRHRGGRGQWRRLRAVMAHVRKLVGAVVTQRGPFASDRVALRKILKYLLHYPVQLVNSKKDDLGSHGKIHLTDEQMGLRLQPFPPPASKLKHATTPVLPGPPQPWDGLTDPYVFLDPFRALAGLVIIQRYYLPGTSRKKKLTPQTENKEKRKKALKAIRIKLRETWAQLWPWFQCAILEYWVSLILSALPPPPDLTVKNTLLRKFYVTDRKTGKRQLRVRLRNATTLEELKAKHPELDAEWDKEKS